ncbi:putative diphthine methyl ester synthase [Nosema granulosis]|uniref:diphthine methyl ester synthase n=1 Tax=Nosema granulosis TaxID=83296 RepID=A0A9P6H312_9MICR|nr:putative diphthine methyl ester synthase [Nosema granulosis]
MLYLIGAGLHSYEDLSLRSINILKECHKIYYENYTSLQQIPIKDLENYLGREIVICDREAIETGVNFFEEAKNNKVAILVPGTPMFATTHIDLVLKANENKIDYEIIHNASILNVYGCLGLYSYHFGKTVSIPYFTDTWKPTSFYSNICANMKNNLHTLCLLDIKVDENRYMSVNEALEQILYCEEELKHGCIKPDTRVFAICRFGFPDECIEYGTVEEIKNKNFGAPLHSLVIPSTLDVVEKEIVEYLYPNLIN